MFLTIAGLPSHPPLDIFTVGCLLNSGAAALIYSWLTADAYLIRYLRLKVSRSGLPWTELYSTILRVPCPIFTLWVKMEEESAASTCRHLKKFWHLKNESNYMGMQSSRNNSIYDELYVPACETIFMYQAVICRHAWTMYDCQTVICLS